MEFTYNGTHHVLREMSSNKVITVKGSAAQKLVTSATSIQLCFLEVSNPHPDDPNLSSAHLCLSHITGLPLNS